MTSSRKPDHTVLDVECPACCTGELRTLTGNIDGFCTECGIVVPDAKRPEEVDLPDQIFVGTGSDDTPDEWRSVFSVSNATERQLVETFGILEDLAEEMSLSHVIKIKAANILASAAKQNLFDGRKTEHVVAASAYIACRVESVPRPQVAFSRPIASDAVVVDRLSRILRSELELNSRYCPPEEYLEYFQRKLDLSNEAVLIARDVLEGVNAQGLTGAKSPPGLAAAAVYYAVDSSYTQETLGDLAGVTRETVRRRLKEFQESDVIS